MIERVEHISVHHVSDTSIFVRTERVWVEGLDDILVSTFVLEAYPSDFLSRRLAHVQGLQELITCQDAYRNRLSLWQGQWELGVMAGGEE